MNCKNCVICNKIFKPKGGHKTCSSECSIENTKLRKKKYFADPKNYKKHLKVMREYMRRPDVMKREVIRKKSPKYKAWWKRYSLTEKYQESKDNRARKSKLRRAVL